MVFQAEDRTRAKRQHADMAIQMALQGRWDEAVELNRAIVESFPSDVDAFNRLGKAYTELGRYGEARDSYMKALDIDATNSIARKNLNRLSTLGEKAPPRQANQKLSPQMFIEETGKTGVTTLMRPDMSTAARLTAGDQVQLKNKKGNLTVETMSGEYIGEVEPKLGQRLVKLMDGGNEYVAAISGMTETDVRVFIRETFQHASQTGKLSFPPTVGESFRPYVKERLIRQDRDDATYYGEGDEPDEWEPRGEDTSADDDGEEDEESEYEIEAKSRARASVDDEDEE